tara:strand:- start:6 stop:785 length:780 start_codon:yes stop_codon:yes gene_type:complete
MDRKLNYFKFESYNNGAPKILILHGLMGSLRNWSMVGKLLSKNFEVHLLDLRNHGESFWSKTMDWGDLANDLVNYLDSQELEYPIHLLGHSYGGKIAMHFATINPKRVNKLVIVDIAAKDYPPHYKKEFESMMGLDLRSFVTREEVSVALSDKIPDLSFRESMLTNLKRSDVGFSWKPNLEILYKNLELIRSNPLTPNMEYKGNTLLVKGELSDFIKAEDISSMKSYFPKLSLVLMKGVGHNPHAEGRNEFVDKLIEWL